MSFIQLKSNNPNFSHIIKKNPHSNMIIKRLRKGNLFAYYSVLNGVVNENEYNIFFKDSDTEVSFQETGKEESVEYLNVSRYNSASVIQGIIDEILFSAVKTDNELDNDNFNNSILIQNISIKRHYYLTTFFEYFPKIKLTTIPNGNKNYTLTIETNKSINYLLNFIYSLSFMIGFTNNEFMDIGENKIEKIIKMFNKIDAPFFIRYLFSRNVLKSRKLFEKYKLELENTNRYKSIKMDFGNTAVQRQNAIEKKLSFNKDILDIGCGEGAYAIPFSKKIEQFNYYAVDIDEVELSKLKYKIKKHKIENIKVGNIITEITETYLKDKSEKLDVLFTEVIEHIHKEEASKLVRYVLDNIDFDNFIITTPNVDFNKHYMLDTFRHDDHKWEATQFEFEKMIQKELYSREDIKYEYEKVGDEIDGVSTTQMIILTKEVK